MNAVVRDTAMLKGVSNVQLDGCKIFLMETMSGASAGKWIQRWIHNNKWSLIFRTELDEFAVWILRVIKSKFQENASRRNKFVPHVEIGCFKYGFANEETIAFHLICYDLFWFFFLPPASLPLSFHRITFI